MTFKTYDEKRKCMYKQSDNILQLEKQIYELG